MDLENHRCMLCKQDTRLFFHPTMCQRYIWWVLFAQQLFSKTISAWQEHR